MPAALESAFIGERMCSASRHRGRLDGPWPRAYRLRGRRLLSTGCPRSIVAETQAAHPGTLIWPIREPKVKHPDLCVARAVFDQP